MGEHEGGGGGGGVLGGVERAVTLVYVMQRTM